MIKRGFFVALKFTRPKYSPIIPRISNWIPPNEIIAAMIEANPSTAIIPKIRPSIMNPSHNIPIKENKTPIHDANRRGKSENVIKMFIV